jgi:hypothetical protein
VKKPDAVPVLKLAARAYMTTGAVDRAERTLQHVIELSPDALDAYAVLGQLYVSQQRLDAARTKFEALAGRAADPVPAQTMVAMISLGCIWDKIARTTRCGTRSSPSRD